MYAWWPCKPWQPIKNMVQQLPIMFKIGPMNPCSFCLLSGAAFRSFWVQQLQADLQRSMLIYHGQIQWKGCLKAWDQTTSVTGHSSGWVGLGLPRGNQHPCLIHAYLIILDLLSTVIMHSAVWKFQHIWGIFGFLVLEYSRSPIPSVSRYIAPVSAGHSFQAPVGSEPVARFWGQAAAINSEPEHSTISDPWSRFLWRATGNVELASSPPSPPESFTSTTSLYFWFYCMLFPCISFASSTKKILHPAGEMP